MSLELLRYPAYFTAILLSVGVFSMVIVFAVHFFVPKNMLSTYFKEPYFSPAEIEFFTGFPFAYMRTVMFMRLVGWPNSGQKRGLTDASRLAPHWFRRVSKVVIWMLLITFPLMMVLIVLQSIVYWILGYW